MSEIIQIVPNKWVSESLLIAITGMKASTIKHARDTSWMEGREFKKVSGNGKPGETAPCFYNREMVDQWIQRMPAAKPRDKKSA